MTNKTNEQKLTVAERREKNNREYERYLNEKVPVCIPLNGEKIGTTTTASCDGKIYEIELGKTVYVPRKLAEVIQRSLDQLIYVQKMIDDRTDGAKELGEY